MPANYPNSEIVGDRILIPPATDDLTSRDRLAKAKEGAFELPLTGGYVIKTVKESDKKC